MRDSLHSARLQFAAFRKRPFEEWYPLFKRCYPVSDRLLAMALGLQIDSFRSLKHGRAQAGRPLFTLTAMLILMRLGKLRTFRDVLNLRTLIASGKIEKLIDDAGIPKLPPNYRCPGRKGHPTTMI